MDGRSSYTRVYNLIQNISEPEVHLDKLKQLIRMQIGAGERTVHTALNLMLEMGFIKENSERIFYYTINKNGTM